jgi:16S rRNA (guanine527-N7)-methyltransferase
MPTVSHSTIRRALEPCGVLVNDTVAERVRRYLELLLRWNRRVNLTSITEPSEILVRHFGESFFAARAVPIEGGRLCDVGSGAGFPGLALRVWVEGLRVTLIEPTTKKAVFLAEVCRELGFEDVEIRRGTMDEFAAQSQFDLVTSRALGRFDELLRWSRAALAERGMTVLWLSARQVEEVRELGGWEWRPPIPLPESKDRVLLVGSPHKAA